MTIQATNAPKSRAKSKIKATSGFRQWGKTLPDIHTLITQIKRSQGYVARRVAIATQYEQDCAAFGAVWATIRAQLAIDKANSIKSDFPLAALWVNQIPHAKQRAAMCKRFRLLDLPEPEQADAVNVNKTSLFNHNHTENANQTSHDASGEVSSTIASSGFLTDWRNGITPPIEHVLRQITPRTPNYRHIRAHIRDKFVTEWTANMGKHDITAARELAMVFAQDRADSVNSAFVSLNHRAELLDAIIAREKARDEAVAARTAERLAAGLPAILPNPYPANWQSPH